MKVLVLGVTGMLGHVVFRHLHSAGPFDVTGVARRPAALGPLPPGLARRVLPGPDAADWGALEAILDAQAPQAIVNCVGLIKQLPSSGELRQAIPVNSLLPHRLARWADANRSRLIHISTDCVFSGQRGGYTEDDAPDPPEVYGWSKLLGEVGGASAVTLRTSLVGRELGSSNGLVEWFLAQAGEVRGFTRAVFSGLTTAEMARVIAERVLPRPDLHGVYHVASEPISKHDLLRLLALHFGKDIRIRPDDSVVIDRSLRAARFEAATGYRPKGWRELVAAMDTVGQGGD